MITMKHDGWHYNIPQGLPAFRAEVIRYAATTYGFLLNTPERRFKAHTWDEFASFIEEYYARSARRDVICRFLRDAGRDLGEVGHIDGSQSDQPALQLNQ